MSRFFCAKNTFVSFSLFFSPNHNGVFNPNIELILNSIKKKKGKENGCKDYH